MIDVDSAVRCSKPFEIPYFSIMVSLEHKKQSKFDNDSHL